MSKKSRARSGQIRSADKATAAVPPVAREQNSRERSGPCLDADKANGAVPSVSREQNSRADGGYESGADKANYRLLPKARDPIAAGNEGQRLAAVEAITFVPPSPQQPNSEEETGQIVGADKAKILVHSLPRYSSDPRIQDLIAEARNRTYWMNMRLRNTARVAAELRRFLQPTRGQEEEWSEDTKKLALEIVREAVDAVQHAKKSAQLEMMGKKARLRVPKLDHPLLQNPITYGSAIALADYETREEESLARMVDITSKLPIASFINDRCKGFSLAGLAVLIGHAGDFRDYPKKGHLWKRLGLAPFQKDGVTRAGSTWGKLGGLSADDWTQLGYKRSRLGDIFGKIVQPLFRAQWQTPGKDDAGEKIAACAQGHYGEVFGQYKALQRALNESGAFAAEAERQVTAAKKGGRKPQKALLEGKLPDSQINSRALRRMAQKLVADLQSAWRRVDQPTFAEKAILRVSAAAKDFEGRASDEMSRIAAKYGVPDPQPNSAPDRASGAMLLKAKKAVPTDAEPNAGESDGHTGRADQASGTLPNSPRQPNGADGKANAILPTKAVTDMPSRQRHQQKEAAE